MNIVKPLRIAMQQMNTLRTLILLELQHKCITPCTPLPLPDVTTVLYSVPVFVNTASLRISQHAHRMCTLRRLLLALTCWQRCAMRLRYHCYTLLLIGDYYHYCSSLFCVWFVGRRHQHVIMYW